MSHRGSRFHQPHPHRGKTLSRAVPHRLAIAGLRPHDNEERSDEFELTQKGELSGECLRCGRSGVWWCPWAR